MQDFSGAEYLAQAIIDSRNHYGSFCRLSELGYLFEEGDYEHGPWLHGGEDDEVAYPVAAVAEATGKSSWGEFEREAIIRNACGLVSVRGQSFIVVVRGESYSPFFGRKKSLDNGTCNAAKTAVAQVWRDTIPQNFYEVEDYISGKNWSESQAEQYRKDHYVFPMSVKFFKIIDD